MRKCGLGNRAGEVEELKGLPVHRRVGTNFFGLDEIVLTTKDAKAANKLVDKIKSDLTSCKRPVS